MPLPQPTSLCGLPPGFDERDGMLRTGDDAETAGMTLRSADGIRCLAPVCETPKFPHNRERGKVGGVDTTNFKDGEGTDLDAIAFRLALTVVDDRNELTGFGATLFSRAIRVRRRATCFLGIQRFRHCHAS